MPPLRQHQVLAIAPSSDFQRRLSSVPASPDLGTMRCLRFPGKLTETDAGKQGANWERPGPMSDEGVGKQFRQRERLRCDVATTKASAAPSVGAVEMGLPFGVSRIGARESNTGTDQSVGVGCRVGEGGDLEQGGQLPRKGLSLEPSATCSQQHPRNPPPRGAII